MTTPMMFGLAVTVSYLLFHRLKSRTWRKWLGLTMALFGAIAFVKFSTLETPYFIVFLMTAITGWGLFSDRDQFNVADD